jgi:hypothetical protein
LDVESKSGASLVLAAAGSASSSGASLVELAFANVIRGRTELGLFGVIKVCAGVADIASGLQVEDTFDEVDLGGRDPKMISIRRR